ncbi:MAG: hypothetical protein E6I23_01970 [Chloroflexi bacterium]|nr:MAG: hypothetical protein E6I23_01970 [Chloroflexota bacterium]
MQTTFALRRPTFSITRLAAIIALLAAFVLGSASGYAVKALSPGAAPVQQQRSSACPAGSHAVVWYTASTWACVKN